MRDLQHHGAEGNDKVDTFLRHSDDQSQMSQPKEDVGSKRGGDLSKATRRVKHEGPVLAEMFQNGRSGRLEISVNSAWQSPKPEDEATRNFVHSASVGCIRRAIREVKTEILI